MIDLLLDRKMESQKTVMLCACLLFCINGILHIQGYIIKNRNDDTDSTIPSINYDPFEDPVYIARHNLTSEQVEAHVMDNLEEACELAQRKHGIEIPKSCNRTTILDDIQFDLLRSIILRNQLRHQVNNRATGHLEASNGRAEAPTGHTESPTGHTGRSKRATIYNMDEVPDLQFYKWDMPIAYMLSDVYNSQEKQYIRDTIEYLESLTCLRFREVSVPTNPGFMWFDYTSGEGCYSHVGFQGGRQIVHIADTCMYGISVVAHEISHALGVQHTQSREDRDQYIDVDLTYVEPHMYHNFEMCEWPICTLHDIVYDYGSYMQYPGSSFTYNGAPSLIPHDSWNSVIMGYRNGLQFMDAKMLNTGYCLDECPNELACQNEGYVDPLNCNQCRCNIGLAGTFCERVDMDADGRCYPFSAGVVEVNDQEGCVTSENYDPFVTFYDPHSDCYIWLQAPVGCTIDIYYRDVLGIANVQLSSHRMQCNHYVEIRHRSNFGLPGVRTCGYDFPDFPDGKITTESDRAMIVFYTDYDTPSYDNLGFKICYSLTNPDCIPVIETTVNPTTEAEESTIGPTTRSPMTTEQSTPEESTNQPTTDQSTAPAVASTATTDVAVDITTDIHHTTTPSTTDSEISATSINWQTSEPDEGITLIPTIGTSNTPRPTPYNRATTQDLIREVTSSAPAVGQQHQNTSSSTNGALVAVFVLLVVLMVLGCSYFAFVLYKRHRDDEEVQQINSSQQSLVFQNNNRVEPADKGMPDVEPDTMPDDIN